jgi:hypothetical protein
MTGTIDAAQQTIDALLDNIPGGYIQKTTVAGTIKDGLINLNYTVYFFGPTSPTNPAHGVTVVNSVIEMQIVRTVAPGTFATLQWTGGHGPYQVQSRTNLGANSWADYLLPTTDKSIPVPPSHPLQQFFRVVGQ